MLRTFCMTNTQPTGRGRGRPNKTRREGKAAGKTRVHASNRRELGYGEASARDLPLPWMTRFLATLRRTGNVSTASKRAGISRQNAYEQRNRHEVFSALWDDAVEDRYDLLEQRLYERATFGWEEPVFGGVGDGMSGRVGERTRYDNHLGRWIIERYRPIKDESASAAQDAAAQIRAFLAGASASVPSSKANEAPDWGAQRVGDAVDSGQAYHVAEGDDDTLGLPEYVRLCVECGAQVSPSAIECPECGQDPSPLE